CRRKTPPLTCFVLRDIPVCVMRHWTSVRSNGGSSEDVQRSMDAVTGHGGLELSAGQFMHERFEETRFHKLKLSCFNQGLTRLEPTQPLTAACTKAVAARSSSSS